MQTIMIDDQGRTITQTLGDDETVIRIFDPDDRLVASKRFDTLPASMSDLDVMIRETDANGIQPAVSVPTGDEETAQIASSAILDRQDYQFLCQLVEEAIAGAPSYRQHTVALVALLGRLERLRDAIG